ncbi:MAG: long-chain fatty acid--CoA ligase [Gammaproteobacteria bacterium]|nr:long-chain fatty acid--CoA ligase [Gammaproteobacteria bacterium]
MPIPHYDWIAHHAGFSPEVPALIDLSAGTSLSYADMHERIDGVASYLRDHHGIRRGDRIAVLAQNRGELFELLFACGRLGAIFLPLNWRLTGPELSYILRDAEPTLLVADNESSALAETLRAELSLGAVLRLEDGDAGPLHDAYRAAAPLEASERLTHDDIQTIMYTSGTTGFPKGAQITYGMTFWNAVNLGTPLRLTPDARFLSVMPMFHTAGLNLFALPVFHVGGTVYMLRSFDPAGTLAALGNPDFGITHFFAVPAAYQFMAQHPAFGETDLGNLDIACVGGAATPAPVLEQWLGRGVSMPNGFGMTETSPAVMVLRPEDAERKIGSVGQPLLHTEIRIVDGEGGECGVDEPGELQVRGPNVSPGYWRNDAASADAFVDGWLRTGDIVRRDPEGFCYILDRAKDMYISGGENVYPAEVENTLSRIDGIAEVAVIGIPDERWGETGLAIIVLKPGAELSEEAVASHCQANLARFKHPRRVEFVDQLPRTATGKIHKPTLREQFS